jgi:murein DD-endopeptidase MepM/ murein hydrolase activator NlpD
MGLVVYPPQAGPRRSRASSSWASGLAPRRAWCCKGVRTPRWVAAAGGEVDDHLLWPVQTGRFGRGFGYVRQTRPDKRHDGIDIVAAEGSTVRAVADGLVVYADNEVRGFGNVLMVVHPNGWVSLYAHLYRITVPAGYRVTAGERVGFVGSTGISHAPHLHFELRVDGRPANPLHLFRRAPVDRRVPHVAAPAGDGDVSRPARAPDAARFVA